MFLTIRDWITTHYTRAVNSIAFYPAIISLSLGLLSILVYATRGNFVDHWLKEIIPYLGESDAQSLRTLMNVITGGSISISVFSFSMVMVVLSQAANTYSPKILDGLIKNKKPQRILGVYIGTVVFCLPQLLLISERYKHSIPPLAVVIAILLAIANMFFFIEFIDFISRSVKPAEICRDIHRRVLHRLKEDRAEKELDNGGSYITENTDDNFEWESENAVKSGYFQGVDFQKLFDLCEDHDIFIKIYPKIGNHVLTDSTLFYYAKPASPDEDLMKKLHSCFFFFDIEDIEKNYFFGYRELAEVGAKAMSPGINDIGTARISVDLLIDLIGFFAEEEPKKGIVNTEGKLRIHLNPNELKDIFELCLDEIRIYSREDKNIIHTMLHGCLMLMDRGREVPELKRQVKIFSEKLYKDICENPRLKDDTNMLLDIYNNKLLPKFKG